MVVDGELKEIEQKFYEEAMRIADENGLDIYDLEYNQPQKVLRIFISNKETYSATLDDCMKVDQALSCFFETSDWIDDGIVLEVSSPGMFRKLKKSEHFVKVVGKRILIHLQKPFKKNEKKLLPPGLEGKKKLIGQLTDFDCQFIGMDIECGKEVYPLTIEIDRVKNANLEPDLDKDFASI